MQKQIERTYNIKPQDFIPLVGSFIYQHRNRTKSSVKGQKPKPYIGYHIKPKPYIGYLIDGTSLTILDARIGIVIIDKVLQGLEVLIK